MKDTLANASLSVLLERGFAYPPRQNKEKFNHRSGKGKMGKKDILSDCLLAQTHGSVTRLIIMDSPKIAA